MDLCECAWVWEWSGGGLSDPGGAAHGAAVDGRGMVPMDLWWVGRWVRVEESGGNGGERAAEGWCRWTCACARV